MEEQNRHELPQEDPRQQVLQSLERLEERCQYFDEIIQRQIGVKDALIDQLHQQLQNYQKDAPQRYILQVMKEIIRVRQTMKKRIQSDRWDQLSPQELRQEYGYVLEDLTDLLEHQGIEAFESLPGTAFDSARQSAEIAPTHDPALDRTVKESRREGFIQNGRLVLAEKVVVYQYRKENHV